MNAKQKLRELGVRPSKRRGQNFLLQENIAEKITDSINITEEDSVLEVGPGLGALTSKLVDKNPARLVLVEIEPIFCQDLRSKIPSWVEIIRSDITKKSLSRFVKGDEKLVFVSNLPYSISSPILIKLINERDCIKSATLLLQDDYVKRLMAKPGSKNYGSISIFLREFFDLRRDFEIGGSNFYPKTSIKSRIVHLRPLLKPRFEIPSQEILERILRAAFSKRRKTFINSLSSGLEMNKRVVKDHLQREGISPDIRAEMLSLEEYCRLCFAFMGLSKNRPKTL